MGACKSQVHQLLIGVVTLFALFTSYAMFSIDMPNMIKLWYERILGYFYWKSTIISIIYITSDIATYQDDDWVFEWSVI